MSWVGYAGLALLGLAALILAFGVVAALPSAVRFRHTSMQTRQLAGLYRQAVNLEIEDLVLLSAERDLLLRPYRRVGRVLTHPLTVALFESYRRRRARQSAL